MAPRRKKSKASPVTELARLKVAVKHIGDRWPSALGRHACLREFGTNAQLHKLLSPSYAAHVHNMLEEVLLVDLIREIGACVLDEDPQTASVAVAVRRLRNPDLRELLEADYRVVTPTTMLGLETLDDAERAEYENVFAERELARELEEFQRLKMRAAGIRKLVIASDVAKRIRKARNKSIAHYDIEPHGDEFRVWHIGQVRLTYGELDAYVAACTECIDTLSLLVRRTSFDFEDSVRIDRKRIAEYVDALCSGLRGHRLTEKIRRLRLVEDRIDATARGRS